MMGTARRRRATVAAAAVGLLAVGALVAVPAGAEVPELAGLKAHGPIADHGFPTWYEDKAGLRLEPCLDGDDPLCGFAGEFTGQASFPDNFPNEIFYSLVGSELETPTVEGTLGLQMEGAWANEAVVDGDQVTFGRVRIRFSGLTPGSSYTVTHPYGVDQFVAEAEDRNINFTEDIGIQPGVFTGALASRLGPFLRWDEASGFVPPAGYVGDPDQEARVAGSPHDTNFFRVVGPGVGLGAPAANRCDALTLPPETHPDDCLQTPFFSVMGKIATNEGVTADQAHYTPAPDGDGGTIVVQARTDAMESITVQHAGTPLVGRTLMGGSDGYYGVQVRYSGSEPPAEVTVSNESDVPVARATVRVTDDVDVQNAVWLRNANDRAVLAVRAVSSDPAAALTLEHPVEGEPDVPVVDGIARVLDLEAPPVQVTVRSDQGGSESREVQPTLATSEALPPTAVPTAPLTVLNNQRITLDASSSIGMGDLAYEWRQVPEGDEPVLFTVRRVPLTNVLAPAGWNGDLHFTLSVSDGTGLVSEVVPVTVTVEPNVAAAIPVATAERVDAVAGTTVRLDASQSRNTVRWVWSQVRPANQPDIPVVGLTGTAFDPVATFTMPALPPTVPYLDFRLRVRNSAIELSPDIAFVRVYQVRDVVQVLQAEYRGADDVRIDGTSSITTGNTVTLVFRDAAGGRTVGAEVPVATDGTWRYRGALPAAADGYPPPTTAGLVVDLTTTAGADLPGLGLEIR
jgi:hypothetical protein